MRNVKNKNSIIYNFNNGDIFIVINTQPGGHYMISTVKKRRTLLQQYEQQQRIIYDKYHGGKPKALYLTTT